MAMQDEAMQDEAMRCLFCGESDVFQYKHVDEDSGWWTYITLCKACYHGEWRGFCKLEELPAGRREYQARNEDFGKYLAQQKARRAQNRVSSLGG